MEFALAGKTAVMPTIVVRVISLIDGKSVKQIITSRQCRTLHAEEFISKDGFGITAKARRYLAPLISGEDYPAFKNGVPDYVRLKNQLVPQKLPKHW